MEELESGGIANPDEDRRVGHYWLRNIDHAPQEIKEMIQESWESLDQLCPEVMDRGFSQLLMVGIGGSALGPQLHMDALGCKPGGCKVFFIDNTDPDGMDRVWRNLLPDKCLVAVLSKSGGTRETRNAMLETRRHFEAAGVSFPAHAIAVTQSGSQLAQLAASEQWFGVLPLWSWVGGRTSVTGMVGLLPLALAGHDWRLFLQGAAALDAHTRKFEFNNPALLLAHGWYEAGEGRGTRNMVVLPYKDRLILFSRYLQQLVMESLGKKHDFLGREVRQGLTVYGNKGATDQHAYIQQLRDGPDDFFVQFVAVLAAREGASMEVEPGVTSGDYLLAFLMGTRNALTDAKRGSMTLTLDRVNPQCMGALIALYERAVGLYAHRIGINAYHQPGVEAGKKAADAILMQQQKLLEGVSLPDSDDVTLLRASLYAQGRLPHRDET